MSDSNNGAVPDGFDPEFRERLAAQWNRGPKVFHDVVRDPVCTEREFMTALLGAANDYVADPRARVPPGRVYLDGDMVPPERLGPLLPRGASENLAQYVDRTRHANPGKGLGIVLDNCEKHVPAMRDRLVPSLHHLFSRAGYPARRNHLCIYAGTYRSTPFGIHRDDCHVIMFCGVGRKSMAFWPREYFDSKPQIAINNKVKAPVRDFIADATVLEIGPADALYWSADDWHVAVSDTDDFQAALSVGIYHHGSSPELITQLDFVSTATKVEGLDIAGLPAAPDGELSADDLRSGQMSGFFERWERVRDALSQPGEVDYRALGLALRLISSAGYGRERTPPRAVPESLDGRAVSCPVPESIVIAHARGRLFVGGNGNAALYDGTSAALERAILALRDGRPHGLDDLAGALDAGGRETFTAVVRDLIAAGALTLAP